MFAKTLEILLANLCQKSDVSLSLPNELADRFDALGRYGQLPRGRENRDKLLTVSEMVAAILGLASSHPGCAGQAAIALSRLRTVGGPDASYFGTETLEKAIEHILGDATALQGNDITTHYSAPEIGELIEAAERVCEKSRTDDRAG